MSYENRPIYTYGRGPSFLVPGSIADAIAQVNIFIPHEKMFVPSAKFLEHVSPDYYTKPTQNLRPMGLGE